MSTVTIPAFAGKTKLLAEDVDAAFAPIVEALDQGLDEDNLAAGALFSAAQLAEPNALLQVGVTGHALLTPEAAISKVVRLPMLEDSIVVGWSVTKKATGAGDWTIAAYAGLYTPETPESGWLLSHSWRADTSDLGVPHFAFDPRGLPDDGGKLARIPKGQQLILEIEATTDSVLQMVALQVLLKRVHSK